MYPEDEEFDYFDSTDMFPKEEDEDFDFSEDLETAPEPELLQVGRGRNRRPTPSFTGNRSPRVVRDGQRFRFNLRGVDEQCVDSHNRLYQWGQFNQVRSFEACATACVKSVPSDLVFSNSFRGIEYIRGRNLCRCLYDRGFLNRSRRAGHFDRANTNERGLGSINRNGGRFNRNYFCGTLAGAEDEE